MITKEDIYNFLEVKNNCTINVLLQHINSTINYFESYSEELTKEQLLEFLIEICQECNEFLLTHIQTTTNYSNELCIVNMRKYHREYIKSCLN